MAIDDQILLAAIDDGRESCYGTDEQSELGQARAAAIEAYLGLNTNPAPIGRSQVVDRSVFETISTMLPSLVRIFAGSSDEVCKFLPVGPEDELGAEQTTSVVNHIATQQNQWEQVVSDWIHDAMLLGNGYCMAYWDESDSIVREVYEDQSEDQLAQLINDDVTVVQHSAQIDAEATKGAQQAYQQAMQQWQMASQAGQQIPPPQPPGPVQKHTVVIDRRANEGKVCIKTLAPEHCYVSFKTPDWTLRDCPYFEFRQQKTIASLRAMGLDVPEDISDDEDWDADEDEARDRFSENRDFADGGPGIMREVWARMIWVMADAEGDNVSRLYYIIAVGRTILFKEPCARIPVASMTPQPLPHRHIGMSIAETVTDIQAVKTAVKRGGLDNLYLANNGRHAVSSKVNLADFLDARPGGVVRMLDDALPAEGHIMPLAHPFAFDSIIGSLEYFDQERQNRTGASRYFSGTDANAINKTASGTMALQNMASMRVEHVARMMAPAVEALFSIVHELISKHRNKPLAIKLRGEWVSVDPQAWRTKRDCRIAVGVGAGNRDSMMAQLQQVLAAQMQIGLPLGLVTRENIHATNAEIAKLAGFANPDKFWPDPGKLPPQQNPPSPEQIKAQAEAQKVQFQAQQDQQKFAAEQTMERERMEMQARLDRQREEGQAQQKTLEQQMQAQLKQMEFAAKERAEAAKLAFEKWRVEFDAALQIALADKTADAGMQQTVAARQPDNAVEELKAALKALQDDAAMPAELVRDPNTGQAVAVKRGARVRKIVRGPDGRAIGVQ